MRFEGNVGSNESSVMENHPGNRIPLRVLNWGQQTLRFTLLKPLMNYPTLLADLVRFSPALRCRKLE